MNPILIAAILLALVAVSTTAGLAWRYSQGRITAAADGSALTAHELGVDFLGSDATIVQFSTEFCSPCRALRPVLEALAADREGAIHLDIDLGVRPALAARFNILQTPTTLILDRSGIVRSRIGGVATADALGVELDRILVTS